MQKAKRIEFLRQTINQSFQLVKKVKCRLARAVICTGLALVKKLSLYSRFAALLYTYNNCR